MADHANGDYNNTNRAFLQAFLARSTLTFDEAKPIIASILRVHGEPPHLNPYNPQPLTYTPKNAITSKKM